MSGLEYLFWNRAFPKEIEAYTLKSSHKTFFDDLKTDLIEIIQGKKINELRSKTSNYLMNVCFEDTTYADEAIKIMFGPEGLEHIKEKLEFSDFSVRNE